MTEMDHGTAHERIEDLLLDPERLGGLQASRVPDDIALRAHLEGCPACREEHESLRDLVSRETGR